MNTETDNMPLESYADYSLCHYGTSLLIDDLETCHTITSDLSERSKLLENTVFELERFSGKGQSIELCSVINQFTFVDECNMGEKECCVLMRDGFAELVFNDIHEAFFQMSEKAKRRHQWKN